jgi:hypothetical protein
LNHRSVSSSETIKGWKQDKKHESTPTGCHRLHSERQEAISGLYFSNKCRTLLESVVHESTSKWSTGGDHKKWTFVKQVLMAT